MDTVHLTCYNQSLLTQICLSFQESTMVVLTEIPQGSSSFHDDFRYDVFLSFRGADTRNSFTDHLYNALKDANLETFLDDEEIDTGLILKPALESAIKTSRASIIVLSKNYASSTWCLEELVLILEQHMEFNQIVMPIFYHVEPTDVRKQHKSFGEAMAKHKERMEVETNVEKRSQLAQKIELWSISLTQVADRKGKYANGRKETELIEEIVTDIHCRLRLPLRTSLPLLIGADYDIKFITSWLTDGSSYTIDILTILGIDGIGKTSLARHVYGLHCHEFPRSTFIEYISRRCAQVHGLLDVQKQLCFDISWKSSNSVHDVLVYTSMIENALARKKVFLVLDDIDSLDQLNALLGKKGLYPGSKIIVTTKDATLTEQCALFTLQVQPKHTMFLLEGLQNSESLELLFIHAFKCNVPKEGFEEVAENLVKYCEGHPLALKILGESLHNKDVTYWEECIERLKREPESCIQKALQMSYESLPSRNDKELFKHIACFFVGVDRDATETILKACNINTNSGITNLIDRCLLSLRRNELMMHQLIQEMGRDVVRQESPNKPWMRTRLWCHEESYKVLKQNKQEKENLLGLSFDMRMLNAKKVHGSFELKTNSLSQMDNLLLLQLNHVQLNGFFDNIPEELRWLCMHGFPLKSIPLDLPMENLVALDLSYSMIESFGMCYCNSQSPAKRQKLTCSTYKQLLGSLKILDLSFCEQLHSLCGFLQLPVLERLTVRNCVRLLEVCELIGECVELVFIDLSCCYKLKKVPTSLGKLKKIRTLLLDGCNFSEPRSEIWDKDSSEMVVADIGISSGTSSTAIVEVIPRDLKSLAISLPCSLVCLSLTYNNLSNESFPNDLSSLSMLKELYLDGNPIVSMPNCVRSLPRLETLAMFDCKMLISIEHPPRMLRELLFGSFRQHYDSLIQKIVFDPEMSPLTYLGDGMGKLPRSSFQIDGMVKIQPMADVEEKVLQCLGWTNLEYLKKMVIGTYSVYRREEGSQTQMYYEFGIFSTIYGGEEMPNWINDRSEGPSISFTIPSSPDKLRGLNFCCVEMLQFPYKKSHLLPVIKISNMTKNHTWIYHHFLCTCKSVSVSGKGLAYLSHWMFGNNEMEIGDQITITVTRRSPYSQETRKCGVTLVYDNGKLDEEEGDDDDDDALGYYKSWNHIIGGDLSSFQITSGEYILSFKQFHTWGYVMSYDFFHFIDDGARFKEEQVFFKAFSQRKSDILVGPSQVLRSQRLLRN